MNNIRKLTKTLFSKYLFVTNTVATSGLLGIGDAITQRIERLDYPDKKHDFKRTGRMLCMGLMIGPVTHVWYKILDKYLVGNTVKICVKKIMADQAVAAPFFCSAFFMGMTLLEGKTVNDGVQEVRSKFLTVYLIDWCVWPPSQFINFYLLPTNLRVVYVNCITVAWSTFLSWMKHREHQHEVK